MDDAEQQPAPAEQPDQPVAEQPEVAAMDAEQMSGGDHEMEGSQGPAEVEGEGEPEEEVEQEMDYSTDKRKSPQSE